VAAAQATLEKWEAVRNGSLSLQSVLLEDEQNAANRPLAPLITDPSGAAVNPATATTATTNPLEWIPDTSDGIDLLCVFVVCSFAAADRFWFRWFVCGLELDDEFWSGRLALDRLRGLLEHALVVVEEKEDPKKKPKAGAAGGNAPASATGKAAADAKAKSSATPPSSASGPRPEPPKSPSASGSAGSGSAATGRVTKADRERRERDAAAAAEESAAQQAAAAAAAAAAAQSVVDPEVVEDARLLDEYSTLLRQAIT
jgi:hypothetical protein